MMECSGPLILFVLLTIFRNFIFTLSVPKAEPLAVPALASTQLLSMLLVKDVVPLSEVTVPFRVSSPLHPLCSLTHHLWQIRRKVGHYFCLFILVCLHIFNIYAENSLHPSQSVAVTVGGLWKRFVNLLAFSFTLTCNVNGTHIQVSTCKVTVTDHHHDLQHVGGNPTATMGHEWSWS